MIDELNEKNDERKKYSNPREHNKLVKQEVLSKMKAPAEPRREIKRGDIYLYACLFFFPGDANDSNFSVSEFSR